MKISARNILKGKVQGIVKGPVSTEVTVHLTSGEEIVSVITRASAQNLELEEGMEVFVVIKASNVMIATD
ncbi:MAG: molybdopterin-binding protein [Methanotrichaceae archaeon]|nr:molybdopterin-binding protein [Methanotrichaceae archaeon]